MSKASKLKCKRISKELAKERPVVSDRKKSMYEGPEMKKAVLKPEYFSMATGQIKMV